MEQTHSGPMTGRTVLVTGGIGGIGRATALGLVGLGNTIRGGDMWAVRRGCSTRG